jgi:5-methyltetrahydropteroyltriglutamate--homocysteine methyltransferase
MRRESYSNRFAANLDGIDPDVPGEVIGRTGVPIMVPRVIGKIVRREPVEVRDAEFLKANTDRITKITLPGPFTMGQQAQDDYYGDEEAMAMDYAAAVNLEARDLKKAGVDIVQFDEPWLQARPEKAAKFGIRALNRALEGVAGPTVVHVCFGYAHLVQDKPSGYSVLLHRGSAAQQIDLSVLEFAFKLFSNAIVYSGSVFFNDYSCITRSEIETEVMILSLFSMALILIHSLEYAVTTKSGALIKHISKLT